MYSALSHTSKMANQWLSHSVLQPASILKSWERLSNIPGGKRVFTKVLGTLIPYTGSVPVTVKALKPGSSVVELRDKRSARNHLNSLHAVALMNLAEFSSGLALFTSLPPGMRSILKGFSIDYHKKARGTIIAESQAPKVTAGTETEYLIDVALKNKQGDVVAVAQAKWRVSPIKN